jgi:Uma2 family endonuclease
VRIQGPVVLDRFSEPQPDLAILVARSDYYSGAYPRPGDVLLGIEVMDTSRGYDRTIKLPLYARKELREVWLIDLRAEVIEVHRRPALRGYREHQRLGRGRVLSPLAFPRLRFRVSEILG